MSSANPITRSTRRRDYDATAGQTVFTLDVYVYDLADVEVWTKLASSTQWTQIFTGYTLAFIAGNQVTATFAVAPRPTAGDAQISVRIQSARNQERITNATRGGTVSSALLEQDLDRISTVLQEFRRDADEFRAGVTQADVLQIISTTGNVPSPTAPNIGRFLRALTATTFGWVAFVSSMISDATAAGLALLTAANVGAQRTALGLVPGTVANSIVQLDASARLPAVDASQLTNVPAAPSRNGLINGNFDVWQFGSSVTPPLSTPTYFADGWLTFQFGAACLVNRQGGNQTPTAGFTNINGANILGVAGNTQVQLQQRIEAARVNAGLRGLITVSGYIFNATGAPITSVTLTLSCPTAIDNWGTINQRAGTTLTVNIPNNSYGRVSWTTDTSALVDGEKGLMVAYVLPGVTAGSVTWTGMKVERALTINSGPTDIEAQNPAAVLAECQRFYEKTFAELTAPAQNAGTTGAQFLSQLSGASGTAIYGPFPFKVPKRALPTITVFNPLAPNAFIRNITNNLNFATSSGDGIGLNQFSLSAQAAAATAQTDRCALHWVADARL